MPESLYALALLACPVGMGLMMRGGSKQQPAEGETATKQAELTRMQAERDQLQAERDHGRTDAPRPASS